MIPLLLGALALAAPCDAVPDGMPVGPVIASYLDGALGAPRRACGRSEIGVGVDARLTADLTNFYGYIPGSLTLDGSAEVGRGVELFGRLEAIRADLGIASLTSTQLGLGHLRLGAAWSTPASDRFAVGVYGSAVLPTASNLYRNVAPLGFDFGFTSSYDAGHGLFVHDSATFFTSFGVGKGPDLPRGGADFNVGLEWRAHRVFGLVVDLDAGLGYVATLDHLSPGFALRFSDGKRFGFELGGKLPVVGARRELLTFDLRASARLGKRAAD
ncbi:MAG TPA: hypothetical protein PKA64_11995 [Myxococcota bacterium]|nr:hypothetical protein [Myxococcota bacterium]